MSSQKIKIGKVEIAEMTSQEEEKLLAELEARKASRTAVVKSDGQEVIIRSDRAGVFFGKIKSRNGDTVIMEWARRIHYWSGACSLSQLAVDGTKTQDNRFSVITHDHEVLGVIEVIPCTVKAVNAIMAVPEWKK